MSKYRRKTYVVLKSFNVNAAKEEMIDDGCPAMGYYTADVTYSFKEGETFYVKSSRIQTIIDDGFISMHKAYYMFGKMDIAALVRDGYIRRLRMNNRQISKYCEICEDIENLAEKISAQEHIIYNMEIFMEEADLDKKWKILSDYILHYSKLLSMESDLSILKKRKDILVSTII